MLQLIQCVGIVFLGFCAFFIFGTIANFILKWNLDFPKTILMGFFCYFGIFQIVAQPLIFTKQPLKTLTTTWVIVIGILFVLFAIVGIKQRIYQLFSLNKMKKVGWSEMVAWLGSGLLAIFAALQQYIGWDTAFYIGTVNLSLYSNSMHILDGYTGVASKYLNLRYSISSFYMNSAVMCQVFGLPAAIVQRYVVGIIGVIMACLAVYIIGKEVWKDNKKKATFFLICWIGLNLFFKSMYTTSEFLILRSYEAKAFCANIVVLGVFYCLVRLWRDMDNKKEWQKLFVVVFASVPISASAMFLVPALIGITVLAWAIVHRKLNVIWYGVLCTLPNICYAIIYLLYDKGYLLIKV